MPDSDLDTRDALYEYEYEYDLHVWIIVDELNKIYDSFILK